MSHFPWIFVTDSYCAWLRESCSELAMVLLDKSVLSDTKAIVNFHSCMVKLFKEL